MALLFLTFTIIGNDIINKKAFNCIKNAFFDLREVFSCWKDLYRESANTLFLL